MTRQEAFDIACKAMLEQGSACAVPDAYSKVRCFYRDDSGRRCAIGALIPDEDYDSAMEGGNPYNIPPENCDSDWYNEDVALWQRLKRLGLTYDDGEFLGDLQRCHDTAARAPDFVAAFKDSARGLATNYQLDASVLGGRNA